MAANSHIQWVHPEDDDDGQRAMERIGVGIGEEFFVADVAGWLMPELSRYSGDGLWQRGRLIVHSFQRYRLTGWHTPQYGESDKGMVQSEPCWTNVVIGSLRTGGIAGDPVLKFPIAKAPPQTEQVDA